jgi:hypothetical protein
VHAFDWAHASRPADQLAARAAHALQLHESEIDHLRRLQPEHAPVRDDEDENNCWKTSVAAAVIITGAQSASCGCCAKTAPRIDRQPRLRTELRRLPSRDRRALRSPKNAADRAPADGGDVALSPFFDPDTRHALTMSGIRAIQAAPLLARDGRVLGVLSTHHRDGVPANATCCCSIFSRARPRLARTRARRDRLEDSSAVCARSCTRPSPASSSPTPTAA